MKKNWKIPEFIQNHILYKQFFAQSREIENYKDDRPNCSEKNIEKYFKRLIEDIDTFFDIKIQNTENHLTNER